jgi:hypothetical protein
LLLKVFFSNFFQTRSHFGQKLKAWMSNPFRGLNSNIHDTKLETERSLFKDHFFTKPKL